MSDIVSMQHFSVTKMLVLQKKKHNFHSATTSSSLSCCHYLWNHSRSHLPVKTAPRHLFVWLQQKIALCHSVFVMIVLFSNAICAQWVILMFFMFILYDYTLQQNFWVGADVCAGFLMAFYIKGSKSGWLWMKEMFGYLDLHLTYCVLVFVTWVMYNNVNQWWHGLVRCLS